MNISSAQKYLILHVFLHQVSWLCFLLLSAFPAFASGICLFVRNTVVVTARFQPRSLYDVAINADMVLCIGRITPIINITLSFSSVNLFFFLSVLFSLQFTRLPVRGVFYECSVAKVMENNHGVNTNPSVRAYTAAHCRYMRRYCCLLCVPSPQYRVHLSA